MSMQSATKICTLLVGEGQWNPAPWNEEEGSQIMHKALQEDANDHVGEEKRGEILLKDNIKNVQPKLVFKSNLGLENFMLAEKQNLWSRLAQPSRFPEHRKWPKRKMLIVPPAPTQFGALSHKADMGIQPQHVDWDQQSQQVKLAGKYMGKQQCSLLAQHWL